MTPELVLDTELDSSHVGTVTFERGPTTISARVC